MSNMTRSAVRSVDVDAPNRTWPSFGDLGLASKTFAVVIGLVAIALVHPLVSLGVWMLGQDYYQHFPLLFLAAGVIAWLRLRGKSVVFSGAATPRVMFWLAIAVVLTTAVFVLPSRWMASLSGVSLLIAAVYFYGGQSFGNRMVGPILLVVAAVPLPVRFDNWFVVSLQQLATWLASVWLELAGIMHLSTGVSIQTEGQDYFVKDACSGINSVFAAVAVGVAYGVIRRYTVRRIALLMIQLLFWVVVANAMRVFFTVYGQSRLRMNLAGDTYHELLGMVTFTAGVLLALSGDHLLRYLRPLASSSTDDDDDVVVDNDREAARWIDRPVTGRLAASLAGGAALVAILVAVSFFSYSSAIGATMSIDQMAELTTINLNSVDETWLPEALGDWKRIGFRTEQRSPDSIFGGMISLTWQYSNDRRNVLLSLDGPYDDWHDLSVCYKGSGWMIDTMRPIDAGTDAREFAACELMLDRQPLDSAQVLYVCVDPTGEAVHPPAYFGRAFSSFVRRFGIGMQDRRAFRGGVIQLQLFDQRAGEISEEAKAENIELLRAATEHLFLKS